MTEFVDYRPKLWFTKSSALLGKPSSWKLDLGQSTTRPSTSVACPTLLISFSRGRIVVWRVKLIGKRRPVSQVNVISQHPRSILVARSIHEDSKACDHCKVVCEILLFATLKASIGIYVFHAALTLIALFPLSHVQDHTTLCEGSHRFCCVNVLE